ncbi:uncharacterized protein [Panulirus ornatus]|uniref:uncharacterized protein n=1 Tax=Panulirus ornatus TaxID=150431 RepID=UPI003A86048B
MNTVITSFLALLLAVAAQGRVIERAISDEKSFLNSVGPLCNSQSACGWEIYGELHRHIYYLRNACQCPPSTRCVRVEDDILQEAYIYKCRRIPSPKVF